MVRASFPSAISRFIALESHIALKKNSLNKLAAFEKRVLDQTTEKTREMAGPLLQKIENRRTELVNRQLTKLKSQEEWIVSKLKRLESLLFHLTPEEVNECFERIEIETLTSSKRVQNYVKEKLNHLRFVEEQPIMHELDNTPHNFISRVRAIAKAVQATGSLRPLEQFNPIQLKEVKRGANES